MPDTGVHLNVARCMRGQEANRARKRCRINAVRVKQLVLLSCGLHELTKIPRRTLSVLVTFLKDSEICHLMYENKHKFQLLFENSLLHNEGVQIVPDGLQLIQGLQVFMPAFPLA